MPQESPAPRPVREVRAVFDDESITVYQAYPPQIADAALQAGTFVAPFKRERMTWIKPSFTWMMYRCGWATKQGQERVLAIRITRDGWHEALDGACLSHFDRAVYDDAAAWERRKRDTAVRVQWDPERTASGTALGYRSLQVGLSGYVVDRYLNEWIIDLRDITEDVHELYRPVRDGEDVSGLLPPERPYPLPGDVAATIGASAAGGSGGRGVRFENPPALPHVVVVETLERALRDRSVEGEAAGVLVGTALDDDDGDFIEHCCVLVGTRAVPGSQLLGLVGLCLGHTARRFGRLGDEALALAASLAARAEADPTDVDVRAIDGYDDVRSFLHPTSAPSA